MIIKIILPIISIINMHVPPIGNIYGKTFTIPLIGKQYIETEYINEIQAIIRLTGVINIDGISTMYCDENIEKILLSENLIDTMSKFKCKINKSYYDNYNDIIIINLSFRSIITKNIILEKINK